MKTADSDVPLAVRRSGNMKKTLVLFDFDGTITTKDTLIELLRFYRGTPRIFWGLLLLSPMLLKYFFKVIPNWRAKEYFLQHFLGGEELSAFNVRCKDFSTHVLPTIIRKKALKAIEKYKAEGATIIVISASAENWVQPWCEGQGLVCLATQLEVKDNKITGNLCGKNCYGEEKVNRLKSHLRLSDYQEIIAYGDSSGDREMFAIAHQKFYKPFRI